LFDDLLLDSRRKPKIKKEKKRKKGFTRRRRRKERGLCVCTKFSTVLGVGVDVVHAPRNFKPN
jgi:hypothetical protein